MGTFSNTLNIIKRRPSVVLLMALFTSVACVFDYILFTAFFGISNLATGNILELFISLSQQYVFSFVEKPGTAAKNVGLIVLAAAVAALILGFLLSGYLNIINRTMEEKDIKADGFTSGFKKYFGKLWFVSFKTMLLCFVMSVFVMISIIPALVLTRAAVQEPSKFLPVAIFVVAVSVIVLFFSITFVRLYVYFWYPGIINNITRPFSTGRRIVDMFFWRLTGRLIIFDFVFGIAYTLIYFSNYLIASRENSSFSLTIIILVLDWIFKTLFFTIFVTFVMSSFKLLKQTARK